MIERERGRYVKSQFLACPQETEITPVHSMPGKLIIIIIDYKHFHICGGDDEMQI